MCGGVHYGEVEGLVSVERWFYSLAVDMYACPILTEKKRKSKWDQSGPGSSGSSPKQRVLPPGVGVQALLNAQLQAEMQKLLKK